jgi:lantibiotic modifying enzyme
MRTPPDDLSQVSTWAAPGSMPGIAHGWHGLAWAWLGLVRAGVAPERPRTLRAICDRMRSPETGAGASLFVGSAARPLVAALASRIDPHGGELAERAIAEWVAARSQPGAHDVMSGTAGALLAAAEIAAHLPGRLPRRFVVALHDECRRDLTALVRRATRQPIYLGLAHGLAGYLLAVEAGRRAFGLSVAGELRRRTVATLERFAIRLDDHEAVFWPRQSPGARVDAHGWCHGAPGIALALSACAVLSGWRGYRPLARRALVAAAALVNDNPSTCCGALGQVQVLVEAARLSGDGSWLDEARRLARRVEPCAADPRRARGLWKGRAGHRFAAWRLACPEQVPFPGLGPLSAHAERRIR